MVRLQVGQRVKTEWGGKWWLAKVVAVDASLVKMMFETEHRTLHEWIYRGSTRLEPLYTELVRVMDFLWQIIMDWITCYCVYTLINIF